MKNTIARIGIITLIVWYFVSVIVGVLALIWRNVHRVELLHANN